MPLQGQPDRRAAGAARDSTTRTAAPRRCVEGTAEEKAQIGITCGRRGAPTWKTGALCCACGVRAINQPQCPYARLFLATHQHAPVLTGKLIPADPSACWMMQTMGLCPQTSLHCADMYCARLLLPLLLPCPHPPAPAVEVVLESDLVDSCKPGDRVAVVGIFRPLASANGGTTSGAYRCDAAQHGCAQHRSTAFSRLHAAHVPTVMDSSLQSLPWVAG